MTTSELAVPVFRPTAKDCEGSWEAYITKIEPRFKKVIRPLFKLYASQEDAA